MFTGYQLIDLSVTLDEQLPCSWPTHLQFQRKNYNWYAKVAANGVELADQLGPYYTEWLLIDEHTGTHFDAPSHFIPPRARG